MVIIYKIYIRIFLLKKIYVTNDNYLHNLDMISVYHPLAIIKASKLQHLVVQNLEYFQLIISIIKCIPPMLTSLDVK